MPNHPDLDLHGVEQLLQTVDLADPAERNHFKQFLDRVPVAIAVSALGRTERIVYANANFERLANPDGGGLLGKTWDQLVSRADADGLSLGAAIDQRNDYMGAYTLTRTGAPLTVDAWSNVIEDDSGTPAFRLVALLELRAKSPLFDELEEKVREKDVQLRELQHRVKNNLQMITALIRMEARGVSDASTSEGFDRLAGRVEALGLLYRALGESDADEVDLGIYLTEIATAVMRAHAVEGIHLDLQADTWLVSLDVAMPAGLVVNELMTNALKHAFKGRGGGVVTLHCVSEASGCTVVVADDGNGLPEGVSWPKPGKLSALIVRSLRQNARATVDVASSPGQGVRVTIRFDCDDEAA